MFVCALSTLFVHKTLYFFNSILFHSIMCTVQCTYSKTHTHRSWSKLKTCCSFLLIFFSSSVFGCCCCRRRRYCSSYFAAAAALFLVYMSVTLFDCFVFLSILEKSKLNFRYYLWATITQIHNFNQSIPFSISRFGQTAAAHQKYKYNEPTSA